MSSQPLNIEPLNLSSLKPQMASPPQPANIQEPSRDVLSKMVAKSVIRFNRKIQRPPPRVPTVRDTAPNFPQLLNTEISELSKALASYQAKLSNSHSGDQLVVQQEDNSTAQQLNSSTPQQLNPPASHPEDLATPLPVKPSPACKLLKKLSFFSLMNYSEIEALIPSTRVISVPPDSIIIRRGEFADRLFIVLSGEVEVFNYAYSESLSALRKVVD